MADEGTFSRAATRLGYTQSAVSQQIAALERMVGTPLFDRPGGPRPVELTEAGRTMVEHARGVLRRLGAAQAEVAAVAAGDRGTIRVGTVQSVGTRVLPRLLASFHERRPGVDIVLRESYDVYELLDAVADGELDVTFTEVAPESRFEYRRMLDDPFVLVAPAGSDVAERGSIPVGEIVSLPLIGYRNGACSTVVERIFRPGDEPTYRVPVRRQPDDPGVRRLGHRLLGDPAAHRRHRRSRGRHRAHRAGARAAAHRPRLARHAALVAGGDRVRGRGRGGGPRCRAAAHRRDGRIGRRAAVPAATPGA